MHKGLWDCHYPSCTRAGSDAHSGHKFLSRIQPSRAAARWSHQTDPHQICATLNNQRAPTRTASSCMDAWITRKSTQVKKEHWNGFRDSGTPHRAGESKKQLERARWGDILGQMQQQRDGCRGMYDGQELDTGCFLKGPDNH